MQIQPISSNLNNDISFKNGLYFAKTPYILFNKKTSINYFANEKFKYNIFNSEILTSKEGFRYIKDDITSADIFKKIFFCFRSFLGRLFKRTSPKWSSNWIF